VRMAQIEAAIQSSGALAKEDDSVEVNNRIK